MAYLLNGSYIPLAIILFFYVIFLFERLVVKKGSIIDLPIG